jgi:predicted AAA+ superfamily ATPase
MVRRHAESELRLLASHFKVVAVMGPRQSGKTTLVRKLFPLKPYFSLENPDVWDWVNSDARGFLNQIPNGAVIDEVQRYPKLLSYLQQIVDESTGKGLFILTGSNHLLLSESISQSLAGRAAYMELLPFEWSEIQDINQDWDNNDWICNGFYPPIHDQKIPSYQWCRNYIKTYIERDIKLIKSIQDYHLFEKFMKVLAGRTGQELNYTQIANEVGIDVKTTQSWVGVLTLGFIVHLLPPYHRNFNKTIVKRPKIYFWDTGIACALLGIQNKSQLAFHPLRGALFETLVVNEFVKKSAHSGRHDKYYFWRDKNQKEIDLIRENGTQLIPIEIKSSETYHASFANQIKYWMKLANVEEAQVIYGGQNLKQFFPGIQVMHWKDIV